MRTFLPVAVISSCVLSEDLKGTCVDGTDPIGVEQTCFGRCHIYESGPGWYGACDSYKVQPIDVTGPCGDSPANACLSTFNAGWDTQKTNCGNCYYVEMRYKDGTVTSTYLKTLDTNGSETKFEMSAPAWVNLCPFVCAGTGECSHDEASCANGIIPQSSTYPGPISCTNERSQITFKRVDCNGSQTSTAAPVSSLPDPTRSFPSRRISTTRRATSSPTPAPLASSSSQAPRTTPSPIVRSTTEGVRSTGSVGTSTTPPRKSTTAATRTASPTASIPVPAPSTVPVEPMSGAIAGCQKSLGVLGNESWSEECKNLCKYYGNSDAFCPARMSEDGLIACVKGAAPYCQRADDKDPKGKSTVIKACEEAIGHPTNSSWSNGCKDLCSYYGNSATLCPAKSSSEGLITCVMAAAPYCQRI